MVTCVVKQCKNRSQQVNKNKNGVTFHKFPNDSAIRSKWIKFVGRENWEPLESSICCEHFTPDCIIRSGKRTFIRKDAVPTLIKQRTLVPKKVAQRSLRKRRKIYDDEDDEPLIYCKTAFQETSPLSPSFDEEDDEFIIRPKSPTVIVLKYKESPSGNHSKLKIGKANLKSNRRVTKPPKPKPGNWKTVRHDHNYVDHSSTMNLKKKIDGIREKCTAINQRNKAYEKQLKSLRDTIISLKDQIKAETIKKAYLDAIM